METVIIIAGIVLILDGSIHLIKSILGLFSKKKIKISKKDEKPEEKKVVVKNVRKKTGRTPNKVKVSNLMPRILLLNYKLKVGDEFDSVNQLATKLKLSRGAIYNWSDKKYIEKVK